MRPALVAALAAAGLLALPDALVAQVPRLMSTTSSGQALRIDSFAESLDASGRRLTFLTSQALVPGDDDAQLDIYLRDRDPDGDGLFDEGDDTIQLVSLGPSPAPTEHATRSRLSADGSTVVFQSVAQLLPTAGAGLSVFAYDVLGDSLSVVSIGWDGSPADGSSSAASVSADGDVVAFTSAADNLVAGLPGSFWDRVFVAQGGVTSCVSLGPGGAQPSGHAREPAVSADGRWVAFTSAAADLVPGDANGVDDIFVHDRVSGATTLLSRATGGAQADGVCSAAALSADGRYVAFVSRASNLAGESLLPGVRHVYLCDRDPDGNAVFDEGNGVTRLVSGAVDALAWSGDSKAPSVSPDGQFVLYTSDTNFPLDSSGNTSPDVHLFDRDPDGNGVFDEGNAHTAVASLAWFGAHVDGASGTNGTALATVGGPQVAFTHDSDFLTAGDENGAADAFVVDMRRFRDLGSALADSDGFSSHATGEGTLLAGTELTLRVIDIVPGGNTNLVLGLSHLAAPFKGGVLVPSPDKIVFGIPVGASTFLELTKTWPAGVPAGLAIRLQWWTADPGLPAGFAASNGVLVSTE